MKFSDNSLLLVQIFVHLCSPTCKNAALLNFVSGSHCFFQNHTKLKYSSTNDSLKHIETTFKYGLEVFHSNEVVFQMALKLQNCTSADRTYEVTDPPV